MDARVDLKNSREYCRHAPTLPLPPSPSCALSPFCFHSGHENPLFTSRQGCVSMPPFMNGAVTIARSRDVLPCRVYRHRHPVISRCAATWRVSSKRPTLLSPLSPPCPVGTVAATSGCEPRRFVQEVQAVCARLSDAHPHGGMIGNSNRWPIFLIRGLAVTCTAL
jgi:hypothetical protein